MGYEIERKFLVSGEYKSHAYDHYVMKQGYLSLSGISVVRVRVKGEKGYITVKGAVGEGGSPGVSGSMRFRSAMRKRCCFSVKMP
ncbi:hypothetical protein SDC9_103263 [bioreactor metagenome]|uniref:CYTH domain-containing protein n=1 Tax=bioreactor metagenome TaxID=1076179 RepID=A0A645ATQ4_9ZZZZ